MRLHRTVRVFTTAAAAVAIAAPAASAYPVDSVRGHAHPTATVTRHDPGSSAWETIGIATGIGITLFAGGVTVTRRHTRGHPSVVQVRATHRS